MQKVEECTHEHPIIGKLCDSLPMTSFSSVKREQNKPMTQPSCKEKAKKLYMTQPRCKENNTFLYISNILTDSSVGYESRQFITHHS